MNMKAAAAAASPSIHRHQQYPTPPAVRSAAPSTTCPSTKRKAAEAALDEGLSDGENTDAAPPPPKEVMSQEWIDSLLAEEIKPLPVNERHLRNPELAEIFPSHERHRAWIRRELEAKGYVEVDDDYGERCELLQAVSTAAFYGREEEEKQAMAKLAALRRR